MDPVLRQRVDVFWDRVLGAPQTEAPVRIIAQDGAWDGALVVEIGGSIRIRCLPRRLPEIKRLARAVPPERFLDPTFWIKHGIAKQVMGPAQHFYGTGFPPVDDAEISSGSPRDVAGLAEGAPAEEWGESGLADDPHSALVLRQNGQVAGAAVLHLWDGVPTDVGLLVHPDFRGMGFGYRLGLAACSEACRLAGFVVWRAADTNLPSLRLAHRLGLSRYGGNLAAELG